MPKRKKQWSKNLEEAGVRIRLWKRSSMFWYSTIAEDGRKVRKSLETGDRALAEHRARAIARGLARARLTGEDLRALTLGQVFAFYFRLKGPGLSLGWRKTAETRRSLFEECWTAEKVVLDISQTNVERYSRLRRSGELMPDRNGRKNQGVRDGTLNNEFRWLSSVFNWARRHKEGGRRLLPENPLHDVTWPREKNPRRPVASHERFTRTLEHVDRVDPEGRLRAILSLARYTGRRADAICSLLVPDLLRDLDHVRAALAAAGMDERLSEYMPHGAILWRGDHDKMGMLFISPLSAPARSALDDYLRLVPRVGAVPLFPSPKDPSKPIRLDRVQKWLVRAEEVAGLPKLQGGRLHPYRRLWASERKHLPDVDVAAAGGWRDTRALKLSYQQADPATVLEVVSLGTG
jgi:hypothetical protein